MKTLLILTKRNCDDALYFADHVKHEPDWNAHVSTENVNDWADQVSKYDLIWMYYYPHIVKPEILELNDRWLNTHPSYLPFNRGSAPNFFSIVTGTPAGVSVHKVVQELDKGKVIARSLVDCPPDWTGEQLYIELESEAIQLTIETFDKIKDSIDDNYVWDSLGTDQARLPHEKENERVNKMSDFHQLRNLTDIWNQTGDLEFVMNIIRAATFSGYEGAYFIDSQGRKIEIKGTFRVIE